MVSLYVSLFSDVSFLQLPPISLRVSRKKALAGQHSAISRPGTYLRQNKVAVAGSSANVPEPARLTGPARKTKDLTLRFLPLLSVFATMTVLSAPPALASNFTFIDQDQDGFVTRQEFYDYLALRHSARDRGKDGFVEFYELTGRFVGGDTPFTQSQARAFMASFDLDRNGKVSSREMIAVIEYTGAFDQYDTNDDGRLGITEARALPFLNPPPKRVPTMPGYIPIE